MSSVSPFHGLRYDPSVVGDLRSVTSPPYDVVTDEQQEHYRRLSRWNVIHLEFNDRGVDSARRADQYREAGDAFRSWRLEGALMQESEACYYPYEMEFTLSGERKTIRGLICSVGIEDWGGSILPHEHVMARQVQDRLGLIRETRANLSPIYSVFSGPCPEVSEALTDLGEPLGEVADEDHVIHRLWRITDDSITPALAARDLLIADGHHRYTVALAYRQELAAQGRGPWDQVMMFIADASSQDLPVLPIHRLLHGRVPEFDAEPVEDLAAALAGVDDLAPAVGLVLPGPRYAVARLAGGPPAVEALHSGPLAGSEAGRDVTFTADAKAAEGAVSEGRATGAVLLPATTAERIRAVIDRGERMPQKSTFFWPKPRTGMVMRPMDQRGPAS